VTAATARRPRRAHRNRGFPTLAAHWHRALDVAQAAVTASLRAELLPPDYCRDELRHLRDENRWLERGPLA
jgi:hypothetical protein